MYLRMCRFEFVRNFKICVNLEFELDHVSTYVDSNLLGI